MNQTSRRRISPTQFLLFAVFVASATSYGVYTLVQQYDDQMKQIEDERRATRIVVAAKSIRAGTTITAEDVMLLEHPGVEDSTSVFDTVDTVIGMMAGDRILAGEPIRVERLVAGGARLSLPDLIEPGMRAVTIRTNRAAGVGGLVQPGNYVDVIVTIRPDNRELTADWVTETILQGVQVVAVGDALQPEDKIEDDKDKAKRRPPREIFVTLEVAPAEAEQLALATSRGEVHLSLRAPDDFDLIEASEPLVTNALLGLPAKVVKAQSRRLSGKRTASASEVAHVTEIIRGKGVTVEAFDSEGDHIPTPTKRR